MITPLLSAVDDTRRLEGHELSGRLFHTLLADAKFNGAYYTSLPMWASPINVERDHSDGRNGHSRGPSE